MPGCHKLAASLLSRLPAAAAEVPENTADSASGGWKHQVTNSTGTRTGVLTPEGAVQAEFCGQSTTSAQAKQKESAKNDLGPGFSLCDIK